MSDGRVSPCFQPGGRVSNRCMVSWIGALCVTLTLMLAISSVSRSPPPPRQVVSGGGVVGWLQAAQKHVQTLEESPTPGKNRSQPERPPSQPQALAVSSQQSQSPPQPPPSSQQPAQPSANPVNVTKPPLYPHPFRLSDLDHFQFVINNDVCGSDPVDMVMIVTSDTRRPSVRTAIRAALPSSVLAELRIRRVFLLAELAPSGNTSVHYDRRVAALQAENHEHADLVVGSFRDAYRNLTYKHLMGLHWAATYCPQTRIILKMDHDIVVDIFQLSRRLALSRKWSKLESNVLIGAVFAGTGPIREPDNKWYVSKEEFPEDRFPAYMSGWLYLVTPDAAARLVAAAATQPFFWVDDAFVTGVVRERAAPGIRMVDFDQLWGFQYDGKRYSPFTMEIGCVYECAAEAQASVSRCNMLVGPYWENRLVMRMFYKHAEYCYRHGCKKRNPMPKICENGGNGGRHREGMPQSEDDIADVAR